MSLDDKMMGMLQGLNMDGLIDKMSALQNTHVTVGNVTFEKADLKRAEPINEGEGNFTKVTWKDNSITILKVSKHQFDKEFNK